MLMDPTWTNDPTFGLCMKARTAVGLVDSPAGALTPLDGAALPPFAEYSLMAPDWILMQQ